MIRTIESKMRIDRIILMGILITLIICLGYVSLNVMNVVESNILKISIMTLGVTAIMLSAITAFTVINHLSRNRNSVYLDSEEGQNNVRLFKEAGGKIA